MVTSDIAGNKENRIIMMSGRCDYNSKRFYATIMLHDKAVAHTFSSYSLSIADETIS